MARSDAVWGIDLGQCALKALRCRPHAEPDKILADAFDYIEYPKILSQPEANRAELIADAIKEFLSRNSVRGDRVAISVPGQTGLARFIKLPPVQSKKIPDIVKYEARQQIPFALEDVIWDYQQMAGGSEEDGFTLETEVGLFAIKRDQVFSCLEPFDKAEIPIDILQLTPLALYNYVVFDELFELPPPDQYDPENPPESVVVLSVGTDTTDLVVTNGYRVWQRSIPLGGNHFTKALTKELKLTFAKAEQLKRNVNQADDQKAVFKAMRPVFSDLATEVQRSLTHFRNIDRTAKIGRIVTLGNALKLPGLQKFLQQQLQMDVQRVDAFRGLVGTGVVDAPAFRENLLSYASCYGLALQGLRPTAIRTNLVPKHILRDRMIGEKKPWAVGAAAALLLGTSLGALGDWRAWSKVHKPAFDPTVTQATGLKSQWDGEKSQYDAAVQAYNTELKKCENVFRAPHERIDRPDWLTLLKAVNLCLPTDPPNYQEPADFKERIVRRNRVYITKVLADRCDNLTSWYNAAKEVLPPGAATGAPAAPADPSQPAAPGAPPVDATAAAPGTPPPAPKPTSPTGKGWIVELQGYHYHNEDPENEQAEFVRSTLMANLQKDIVEDENGQPFPVGQLRIGFPCLLKNFSKATEEIENPEAATAEAVDGKKPKPFAKVTRYNFTVQFAWSDPPAKAPAAPGAAPNLAGGPGTPGGPGGN